MSGNEKVRKFDWLKYIVKTWLVTTLVVSKVVDKTTNCLYKSATLTVDVPDNLSVREGRKIESMLGSLANNSVMKFISFR